MVPEKYEATKNIVVRIKSELFIAVADQFIRAYDTNVLKTDIIADIFHGEMPHNLNICKSEPQKITKETY